MKLRMPKEFADENFKPSLAAFPRQDKRRWLDFITWYHQAIIDFAEQSREGSVEVFSRVKGAHQAGWQRAAG